VSDRKRPLKDTGSRRPVPVPARDVYGPPMPNPARGWDAEETKRVKAAVSEDKNGDTKFIRFSVPIVTLRVKAEHWADDQAWVLTHHRRGWVVQYPNGQKTSFNERKGLDYLRQRFGSYADNLVAMVQPTDR
jgi:hypothetical protein